MQELLEGSVVREVHSVPKLRLSGVKKVNTIKVKIFLVPSEHRFPRSNVHVRMRYSWNVHSDQSLIENGAQLREIPRNALVE